MIAKAELAKALESLRNLSSGAETENEVILLSGRLNSLEKENRSGVITRQDYDLSRNRITYSMLELVRRMEVGDFF